MTYSSTPDSVLSNGHLSPDGIFWNKAINDILFLGSPIRRYIDFTSGILVSNVGHSNPRILRSIKNAINSRLIHSYHYRNSFKQRYLKDLASFFGADLGKIAIHVTSSGTEATESALKIMLRNSSHVQSPRILSFSGNYHGRTMGASYMGSAGIFAESWPAISDYFPKISFPYRWQVAEENAHRHLMQQLSGLPDNTLSSISGVIVEAFQGWCTGLYPVKYIQSLADYAKKRSWILCFDEMQSGFYRTGTKFAYEHYSIYPDLLCIGKGMGGGMPLSGVIGKHHIMSKVLDGELSSTHSFNPTVCAAGSAVIKEMSLPRFQKQLTQNVLLFRELSQNLLAAYPGLQKRSSFIGLVGSIVFDDRQHPELNGTQLADRFVDLAYEKKILVIRTGRESVKLAPPLTITGRNLVKAFNVFEQVLKVMYASS